MTLTSSTTDATRMTSDGGRYRLRAFFPLGGKGWGARLPAELRHLGDRVDDIGRFSVELYEDDRRLGPGRSTRDAIIDTGLGAYSVWNGDVLLSTPDGGDPNTNGRSYTLRVAERGQPSPLPETALAGPFEKGAGHAWFAPVPRPMDALPSNTNAWMSRSRLRLLEDGVPLRRSQAFFQTIEQEGRGAYNHIGGRIYFATSDNTDPNANGRRYTLTAAPARPKVASFGSCHSGAVSRSAAERGMIEDIYMSTLTHYPQETLQLIQLMRHETYIPDPVRGYCLSIPSLSLADTGAIEEADAFVIEICNPIVIEYRGYYLNLVQVAEKLVKPLAVCGRETARAADLWLKNGIRRGDETERARWADHLLDVVPDCDADTHVMRDVLRRVKGRILTGPEMRDGIAAIVAALGRRPAVILLHTLRYMPDGRPIYWVPEFRRNVQAACQDLNLPLVDPSEFVQSWGVDFSLTSQSYYTPAFIERLADEVFAALRNAGVAIPSPM